MQFLFLSECFLLGRNYPSFQACVVDATDGSITLSIFNYEVVARVSIAGSVEKPGKTLVQARLLAEIVSKLPSDSVSIELLESRVAIDSGNSKFRYLQ